MFGILSFFEISRRVDEQTLQEAKIRPQQPNYLIHNVQEWTKENPNVSRSLFKWADRQEIKL